MITFPNAKINIGLFITEKRPDNYHNLETIFFPVPLKDALEIIPQPKHEMSSLHLHGLEINGSNENNLIWKAYELLRNKYAQLNSTALDIHLLKKIPMGAGMGGGSADGAFMLQLLNDYFELNISKGTLKEMAATLGSDCAFFIENQPCFASGRGEILEPIPLDLNNYSIQLVCPKIHISTATAFNALTPKKASFDLRNINSIKIEDWKHRIFNDFEENIFKHHPILDAIKQSLYDGGALYAAMSGTGSTIYGIFPKGTSTVVDIEIPFENYIF